MFPVGPHRGSVVGHVRSARLRLVAGASLAGPSWFLSGLTTLWSLALPSPVEPCVAYSRAHDDRGLPRRSRISRHARSGGSLDGAVEGVVRRGHHDRVVHRLRRLCRHVSARRDRLRARGGQVHPLPSRRGAGPRQLRPRIRRRRRLHDLHPGVSPVPGVGAVGRHAPVRSGSRARRDGRHLAPALPHPRQRRHGPQDGPGRRARLGDADLAA